MWNWIFWMYDKDLMVLVPLKKTLTLYSARVHLYCLLRPLMHGMTTLVSSMNFPVDRFAFMLGFCWVLPCLKNCAGWWLSCRAL